MRPPYQYWIPLLSLFLVRVDLTDLYSLSIPVRLIEVLDGDTVRISQGSQVWKLRFSRIDSPEKGQPFLGKERGDAGRFSTMCFKKVIGNRRNFMLRLEKFDVYGRMLGDLDNLSFDLVRNGCAGLYPMAEFSSRREKWIYLRALYSARARATGVWEHGGYETPKSWRKKYMRFNKRIAHRPSRQ
jgi:micrococcal nuclease